MVTTGRIQRTEEEIRKRPVNRLQTVYPIRAMVDERYKAMQEAAKEEGKPVVWSTGDTGWGSHIYKVMGVDDNYWDGYSPVVAAAGVASFFLDRCDAEGFPSHVCGYYRVALGYAARMAELGGEIPPEAPPGKGIPKPTFLIHCNGVCDTHQKSIQAMGSFLDAPTYIMENRGGWVDTSRDELDKRYYEDTVKFLVKETKLYIAWLERLLGKKFDWDAFEEDLDMIMRFMDMWYETTDEMRKVRPCPMNCRDHFTAITTTLFKTADFSKATGLFKNLRDEVKYRVDNKISGINRPEKYRVIMGSIPPWHSMGTFDQLAERGWNFVREPYHPPDPIDLSWVKDPAEKAVRYYRRWLADEIDYDFKPEEAARVKKEIMEKGFSPKLAAVDARKYQVDGYFLHPMRTCHVGACGTVLMQHQLMEAYKVPSILIDGDHIDVRLFDPVDAMKRFEAFEETMDHYKEVRRKEGLEW